MQAQIFPRGTYAPTMGVFTFAAQDPRSMSDNMTSLFGAPETTAATSSTMGKSKSKKQQQPEYFSAYASMRAASPPISNSSHSSSMAMDESSSTDEAASEEEDAVAVDSCNPSNKGKLSRAFKSLKKLGGK